MSSKFERAYKHIINAMWDLDFDEYDLCSKFERISGGPLPEGATTTPSQDKWECRYEFRSGAVDSLKNYFEEFTYEDTDGTGIYFSTNTATRNLEILIDGERQSFELPDWACHDLQMQWHREFFHGTDIGNSCLKDCKNFVERCLELCNLRFSTPSADVAITKNGKIFIEFDAGRWEIYYNSGEPILRVCTWKDSQNHRFADLLVIRLPVSLDQQQAIREAVEKAAIEHDWIRADD